MQNKVDEAINAIKAADEYNLFTERYKTNPPEPVNFRWEQIEISRKIFYLSFFFSFFRFDDSLFEGHQDALPESLSKTSVSLNDLTIENLKQRAKEVESQLGEC